MEPECLEPLNLVIKKDSNEEDEDDKNTGDRRISCESSSGPKVAASVVEEQQHQQQHHHQQQQQQQDDSNSTTVPADEQKFLTAALYMSSIMQMSNAGGNVYAHPQQQQSFVQLLAMIEARHRIWQQLNWSSVSTTTNFLRNPMSLPQPYFDGQTANVNEQQLSSSTNSSQISYSSIGAKSETTSSATKQLFFKRYS